MNQMLEIMFAQFSGQGYEFSIVSPEGYEYVAYLKSPLNSQDNFSEFSADERVMDLSASSQGSPYEAALAA